MRAGARGYPLCPPRRRLQLGRSCPTPAGRRPEGHRGAKSADHASESVAETRHVLALQDGPTVLVAHSWGGTVLSEAGTDPKVTALVYVAARAPDAGEDFVRLVGGQSRAAQRQCPDDMLVNGSAEFAALHR